jgi:hypothetical protein
VIGQARLNRGVALFELDRVAEAEADFAAAGAPSAILQRGITGNR